MQFELSNIGSLLASKEKMSGVPLLTDKWMLVSFRGAMQFQVQAGAPGKKTSGAPN